MPLIVSHKQPRLRIVMINEDKEKVLSTHINQTSLAVPETLDQLCVNLYKYREKVLITWNRSEDQLHTLLDIANTQFPQHI